MRLERMFAFCKLTHASHLCARETPFPTRDYWDRIYAMESALVGSIITHEVDAAVAIQQQTASIFVETNQLAIKLTCFQVGHTCAEIVQVECHVLVVVACGAAFKMETRIYKPKV